MRLPLLLASLAWATTAFSAAMTQVYDFTDDNPTGTEMYIYMPDKVANNPPMIVAIHYCSGSAEAYYNYSPYAQLADQYGFIVLFPQSQYDGHCWDVASQASLTHGGKGDTEAIADMITYAIQKYDADADKVFVTGSSSGAMMVNVLAATYPELFKAGSVYSGNPAGCFVNPDHPNPPRPGNETVTGGSASWNASCAQGLVSATPEHWTSIAHAMYPSYPSDGPRPRMQIYHGSTDDLFKPPNFNETIKQWTGVVGYDWTAPDRVTPDYPAANYTTYVWGFTDENPLGTVQGVYAIGVGHTVPIFGDQDLKWFGIGPHTQEAVGII